MDSAPEPATLTRKAAVVINPTKFDDLDAVQEQIRQQAAGYGWEMAFYETTPDDGGTSQVKCAIEEGAELVCSLGGDGTVRAVAETLVETDIPLGLLPGGTGNLLARNLGLPVALEEALDVALLGEAHAIDVGVARCSGGQDAVFLVAGGLGLDAAVMANTDEGTKKRLGWVAYGLTAIKTVTARGFRVSVEAGSARTRTQYAQTVMVGNCGELRGGLRIMPAELTDGLLHTLLLAPRGVFGWAAALVDLVTRHHRGHPRLQRFKSEHVRIETRVPVTAQLDGDVIGRVTSLDCTVKPLALLVQQERDTAETAT